MREFTAPFEETNVKQATVGETLLYPSSPGPSQSSPPPDLFLFSKNNVTASLVVSFLRPLT